MLRRRGGEGLGRRGERIAARYLRRRRYRVLARNERCRAGELDLICLAPDRRTVVFVEVKTRIAEGDGPLAPPEASVTARKRRKLLLRADIATRRHGWEDRPRRIDVVAVECPPGRIGRPAVRHFENAVMR